jgi:APA family basic amino acid/polyamine antiporter
MNQNAPPVQALPRVLGPLAAWSLVVGSVIGSGIFIVPARVARDVRGFGWIALAWLLGGLLSLAGALSLAELGAMLPHAGGPYAYLKAAYGRLPAFLFGWTEFLVIRAGSVATLAAAFALFFSQLVPPPAGMSPPVWQGCVAVAAILFVAGINIAGTGHAGWFQALGTLLKIATLLLIIVLPWVLRRADLSRLEPAWTGPLSGSLGAGILAAMVGILWTYDGWVNASSLGEEIINPGRNIPRALLLGLAVLIAVYMGATLAYHLVIPADELAELAATKRDPQGRPLVAARVFFEKLLGDPGVTAIALVVMTSTLIALNGNALSGPRAYYAMARDGLAPRWLAGVHPRFHTPAAAIAAQALWAVMLTALATLFLVAAPPQSGLPRWILRAWNSLHHTPLYDVMYTYTIFGATAIYTLTMTCVFTLRRRHPDWVRPYRAWGYPWTPLGYIAAMLFLLKNMLDTTLLESLAGLGIIALGIPAYLWLTSRTRTEPLSTPA